MEETACFLEECDLCGPAQVCQANGVCGEDLLGMTTATLVEDLRCTPIAARKVLGARDRYFR